MIRRKNDDAIDTHSIPAIKKITSKRTEIKSILTPTSFWPLSQTYLSELLKHLG